MIERIPLVVLGLGTTTHGDDGLGSAAVDVLRRAYEIPAGIRVGIAPDLPADVTGERAVIVLSAVPAEAPPGAFIRLAGRAAAAAPTIIRRLPALTGEWLDGGRAFPPTSLLVLGLVPGSLTPGAGLSPAVAAGVQGLVRHLVVEARHLGHEFRPRRAPTRAAA